jgi:hypothetical protein
MLNATQIKALKLTPGQVAACALWDDIYHNHPEKINKLLKDHGQTSTGNIALDLMQVSQLAGKEGDGIGRGRFFTEDFEDIAKEAKYFSLGDVFSSIAPIVGAAGNIFAPGAGTAVGAVLGSLGGSHSSTGSGSQAATEPPPPPPPSSPNTLVADPNNLTGTWSGTIWNTAYKSYVPIHINGNTLLDHPLGPNMPITVTSPGNISIPGLNVTGVVAPDGKTIIFSNGGIWVKLANDPAAVPMTPQIQSQLQNIYSQTQTNPNLDNRPGTSNLVNTYNNAANAATKDTTAPATTIWGMSKTAFYIGLGVLVLAIIVTVAIIWNRKKKKELAEKKS